jgi:NAD(P)H-hydrate epimerase
VIDADALVALSHSKSLHFGKHAPWILTPHPGEWARLSSVSACQAEQQAAAAIDISRQTSSIIVLKGHQTLITDGRYSFRNQTGTPAMATGGSGDVLTGVIVALVCQGLSPLDATRLAVHVHGRAGQIAAESLGTHVVLPTELISYLPAAFREVIG